MAAPKKKGLSLYADLLPTAGTISSAPVKYGAEGGSSAHGGQPAKKPRDAALQFQPVPRPAPKVNKPKPAHSAVSPPIQTDHGSPINHHGASIPAAATVSSSNHQQAIGKFNPPQLGQKRAGFDDWVGDEYEDEAYYDRPKPARKKNKKTTEHSQILGKWEGIYDPTVSTNQDTYKASEQRFNRIVEWKAYIHKKNVSTKRKTLVGRPSESRFKDSTGSAARFAPPAVYDGLSARFAPPAVYDDGDTSRPPRLPVYQPPPTLSSQASSNESGEDAYTRRLRMSAVPEPQIQPTTQMQTQPIASETVGQPDNHVSIESVEDEAAKRAKLQADSVKAKIEEMQRKIKEAKKDVFSQQDIAVPPPPPPPTDPPTHQQISVSSPALDTGSISQAPVRFQAAGIEISPPSVFTSALDSVTAGTISRAPVRYQTADTQASLADSTVVGELEGRQPVNIQASLPPNFDGTQDELEQHQGNAQKDESFAERYMKKLGWDKKKGLGAQEQGIITAIQAMPQKSKKYQDGKGGWSKAPTIGKIVGGKKNKSTNEEDANMVSLVVKLEGMLNGLDVMTEVQDNGLMQEIGEDMDKEYGKVERLFIWMEHMGGNNEVFVKFTNQMSAIRAVNGLDNTTFSDNQIKASFWDVEKFENGEYI